VSIVQGGQYLTKTTDRPYVEYLCAIDRLRHEKIVGCCWQKYSRVLKSTAVTSADCCYDVRLTIVSGLRRRIWTTKIRRYSYARTVTGRRANGKRRVSRDV